MLQLTEIVDRLADEGVPVAAIARATGQPTERVREKLEQSLRAAHITELPRADWPPGKNRNDRVPERPPGTTPLKDEQIVMALGQRFKITKMQATILLQLIRRPRCTKETLHAAVNHGRADDDWNNLKVVDVQVCRLRKIPVLDGFIKTIWGSGYFIEPADRVKVAELLRDDNLRLHISHTLDNAIEQEPAS